MMRNAFLQGECSQSRLLRYNFYLLAIQVVTGMDLPTQIQLIALLVEIKGERLIDRNKPALTVLVPKEAFSPKSEDWALCGASNTLHSSRIRVMKR